MPSESWKEEMIKEASGIINISVRALIKDLDAIKKKIFLIKIIKIFIL